MKSLTQRSISAIVCCFLLTACSAKEEIKDDVQEIPVTQSVANSNENEISESTESNEIDRILPLNQEISTEDGIEVDLTSLSGTMVYAEVNHMMNSPQEYEGKKVKIEGTYNSMYYEPTNQHYFYVLVSDALECCQQGIEFVWDGGNHVYPDEYPKEGAQVQITGVYRTYTEDGDSNLYCHLLTDEIVIIE